MVYTINKNQQVPTGDRIYYVVSGGTFSADDLVLCALEPNGEPIVQFLAAFVATEKNEE